MTPRTRLSILLILSLLSANVRAGMECLKNRDCMNKHEHLCNMQNGMWTKNFVLIPKNGTFEEQLDSCSCCFLPDVFKIKSSQRSLLESVLTLESVQSYIYTDKIGRARPCAPLRKTCNQTSDCCTGYCSVVDEFSFPGYCTDPNIMVNHHQNPILAASSSSSLSSSSSSSSHDDGNNYRNRNNRYYAASSDSKDSFSSMSGQVFENETRNKN